MITKNNIKINGNNNIIYNKNFRNNQNYIIWDLDKKFMIYSFFEKKNRYILKTISIILLNIVFLTYIVYDEILKKWLINPISFDLNFIGEEYIYYIIILFFLLFSIFILFYMCMYLINYSYIMRFNKKVKIFFKKKTKWILLKKHPKWKYNEISIYLYTDKYEKYWSKKMKEEINNDFIYIKK